MEYPHWIIWYYMGDYNPAVGSFPVPNSPRGSADRGTLSAAGKLPLARCVGSLDFFFSLEAGLKFETT